MSRARRLASSARRGGLARLASGSFLALCVLPLIASPALAAPGKGNGGWELAARDDDPSEGYVIHARPRSGSRYSEYRMEIRLAAKPAQVAEALERNLFDPDSYPVHFERELLRREGEVIVSYDYIRVPFASDRDVVMRTEIGRDASSGHAQIRWRAAPEEPGAPTPRDGVVRMTRSQGSWTILPAEGGGTRAVYQAHMDLGGSLPAAFVEARMPESIVQQAEALRRTVRELLLARN